MSLLCLLGSFAFSPFFGSLFYSLALNNWETVGIVFNYSLNFCVHIVVLFSVFFRFGSFSLSLIMYFLLVPIAKFLCLSFFGKQTKKHKSSFFGDITKGRVVNA